MGKGIVEIRAPYAAVRLAGMAGANVPLRVECDTDKVSDGYHTFGELYEHRHALFLVLMKAAGCAWWSKVHGDGSPSYPGWVLCCVEIPGIGQVSYHLPERLLPEIIATGAEHLEKGKEWDGHTAADVVQRLLLFVSVPLRQEARGVSARRILQQVEDVAEVLEEVSGFCDGVARLLGLDPPGPDGSQPEIPVGQQIIDAIKRLQERAGQREAEVPCPVTPEESIAIRKAMAKFGNYDEESPAPPRQEPEQVALAKLQEAIEALKDVEKKRARSRALSIAITEAESGLLWLQEHLRLQEPPRDERPFSVRVDTVEVSKGFKMDLGVIPAGSVVAGASPICYAVDGMCATLDRPCAQRMTDGFCGIFSGKGVGTYVSPPPSVDIEQLKARGRAVLGMEAAVQERCECGRLVCAFPETGEHSTPPETER